MDVLRALLKKNENTYLGTQSIGLNAVEFGTSAFGLFRGDEQFGAGVMHRNLSIGGLNGFNNIVEDVTSQSVIGQLVKEALHHVERRMRWSK